LNKIDEITPEVNTARVLRPNPLIAIEGIDGSGKGTQAQMLREALHRRKISAELFSFPAYDLTLAGTLIGAYLNSELGDIAHIDSRLTALLFALDRFERKKSIEQSLQLQQWVICDRYVGSNLAHQVGRTAPQKRVQTRAFIEKLEYDVFGLPRPQLVLYLDMPPALAQQRIRQKEARVYTHQKLDAHENDSFHLRAALEEYHQQLKTNPDWVLISTVSSEGDSLNREEIHQQIMGVLQNRHLLIGHDEFQSP
jgi:dTMP kinase